MTESVHSRPLWVGLLAATLFMPTVAAALVALSAYSIMVPPLLVFIVGIGISGLVTIVFALPLVLWLRRTGRLSPVFLCVAGVAAGALAMGLYTVNSSYYPQMEDRAFAIQIAKDAALKSLPEGGLYGLLSAVALCVGAGITRHSSGRPNRPPLS